GAAVSRFAGRFRQGGVEGLALDAAFRYETMDARVDHPVGRHVLSVGGRLERTPYRYFLEPGSDFADRLVQLDVEGVATSSALFLEDRWRPVPAVEARLGLRAEKHGAFAWRWLPRAGLAVEPSDRLRVSLAGGRYAQGFTSLRNEEAGLASIVAYDLLVPPTSALPGGWDVTVGLQWHGDVWSVRTDAYWKRLEDVPLAPREPDPATAPIYLGPEDFGVGDGRVRGLELGVRGGVGGWDVAASYRLQKEERRAGDLTWTPRSDRTHRLTLAGRRRWGEGSVNVALSWTSGQPFTPVSALVPGVAGYDADGRALPEDFDLPLLGPHNSARLPGYLRLDVGVRGRWRWSVAGRDIEVEPYLSVMNVLNRKNVLWGEYAGGRTVKLEYGPQLPVLPSFGLRFRF
ncbi:MAG: TonB-dependent receptor, partial [Gemmatimonadota bacterium]